MAGKVSVTLVRSLIGQPEKTRRVVRALGLRKLGSSVAREQGPALTGILHKVQHLVKVEEL